jgi:Di-haem cytochrome c peroxidase
MIKIGEGLGGHYSIERDQKNRSSSKKLATLIRKMLMKGGYLTALVGSLSLWSVVHAFPVTDDRTGLPVGSELDADAIDNPREVFHSETLHGRKSYLSNLGNLAFNSPLILGAAAQKAGISCGSCHVNGVSNPKLFIPGLSTRPGTFDTTSAFFNLKADNGVLDPVTIPSLRGARYLAPYGHDGRTPSLRDFVRNVIVTEFAGTPPSEAILDAIVVYTEDIDFLPNPRLEKAGRLAAGATSAQQHGEALFNQPFPHAPDLSCAACHVPSAAFADHQQHDIGSGGLYKTPTLMNADFNAPYFHDGRFDTYDQVVGYFNQKFDLGLTAQDRFDLVAYLVAVGDGVRPEYRLSGTNVLSDIDDFASILDIAIANHDTGVIAFAVPALNNLLQGLADHYPDPASDSGISGGANERSLARATVAALIKTLNLVNAEAAASHFDAAAGDYLNYRKLAKAAAPLALQTAQPWSLYDPTRHAAQQDALRQAVVLRQTDISHQGDTSQGTDAARGTATGRPPAR